MDSKYLLIGLAVIAGLAVLTVIMLVIHAVGRRVKGREGSRLEISEYQEIDKSRRLVLVRRDNVEHLLLLGGSSDLVVETGIGAKPSPTGMTLPGLAAGAPAPATPALSASSIEGAAPAPRLAAEPQPAPRPQPRPAPAAQRPRPNAAPDLGTPTRALVNEPQPAPPLPPIMPVSGPQFPEMTAQGPVSPVEPPLAPHKPQGRELRVPESFSPTPVQGASRPAAVPPVPPAPPAPPPPAARAPRLAPEEAVAATGAAITAQQWGPAEPSLAPAPAPRLDTLQSAPPYGHDADRLYVDPEEAARGPQLDFPLEDEAGPVTVSVEEDEFEPTAVSFEDNFDPVLVDFPTEEGTDVFSDTDLTEPSLLPPVRPTPPRMEAIRPEPPRKPGDLRTQIPLEPAQIDLQAARFARQQGRPLVGPAPSPGPDQPDDTEFTTPGMSWAFRNQDSRRN